MKILIAPNTFRGSIDAIAAADAIALGLGRGLPDATFVRCPIADGGDMTTEILVSARAGRLVSAAVLDPLGRPHVAQFGLLPDGTGVVEVAASSGARLLAPSERNPMRTTSYGTGQLIRAALDAGASRLIVGLGGSATVDGGAGILEALGGRLLDAEGAPIGRGGGELERVARIDVDGLDPRLQKIPITVACDVDNPLLGESGAAHVFGPQKGATPEMVLALDRGLSRLATALAVASGKDVLGLRGGGAAGGISAMLWALSSAQLERGIELMLKSTGFYDHLASSDLVVTSEGLLDRQTLQHKAPYGVAVAARARGVPVLVLAGGIHDEVTSPEFAVFDAMIGICRRPMPLEVAMERGRNLLELAAEQAGRLITIGARLGARGTNP